MNLIAWMLPSSISVLVATLIMALVYWYLYVVYRDRYLKFWAASWSVYSFRYIFLIAELTAGKSLWLTCGYQIAAIVSAILLIRGTQLFSHNRKSQWWGVVGALGIVWVIAANSFGLKPMMIVMPTFCLLAFADFQVSYSIWTRSERPRSLGGVITAVNFFLWGVHKLDYPLLRYVEWFAPVGYLLGGVFAMVGSMGMVLIFFERMRASMAQEEERLRKIMDGTSDALYLVNTEGVLVDVNNSATQKLGYEKAELVGKQVSDVSADFDEVGIQDTFRRVLKGERVRFLDHHRKKDGYTIPVELMVSKVDIGGHGFLLGSARDLSTEQILAEEKRKSDLLFRDLLIAAIDGFILTDMEARIVDANDKACNILGYSREELLSMGMADLDVDMTEDKIAAVRSKTIEAGENRFESRQRRKDGVIIDVEVSSQYQSADGGRFVSFFRDITERKISLEALTTSESNLRRSQEIAHMGSWTWDTRSSRVSWSEEMYGIFGIEPGAGAKDIDLESVVQRSIHPDDLERVNAMNTAVLENEAPREAEYRVVWPDGTVRHVWAMPGGFSKDEKGNILKLWGIVQDITERKKSEEAFVAQKHLLEKAQELGRIGTWNLDIRRNRLVWTDENCRIFGVPVGSVVNYEVFLSKVHPEDRDYVYREWMDAMKGKSYDIEHRLLVDGQVKWVREKADLTFDNDGEPLSAVGFTQDITDRKNSEQLLRDSEAMSQLLLQSVAEGIYGIGKDGRCTFCNKTALSMFGFQSDGAVLGRNMHDLIHYKRPDGSPYPPNECKIFKAFKAGKEIHADDEVFWRVDGTAFPTEYWSYPMRRGGEVVGAVVSFLDISERLERTKEKAELESRLSQAQKMEAIGTLAGGIAHDFNNILGSILGYTELTLSSLPPESEERENLQEVLVASGRAKELVKQILAFGRKGEKKAVSVDSGLLVTEAMKLLVSVIPKTISIEREIDPAAGHVLADPTEFHQVVMNLCTNAYQAMSKEKGLLRVRLSSVTVDPLEASTVQGLTPGEYVRLEVIDNGSGMDQVTIARIFEPYFTTKPVGKGTGLGLALVHGIVTSIGGAISVRSTPSIGTSFAVYLPRTDPFQAEAVEHKDISSLRGKGRVLVVDDEPALARLAGKMLESLGYKVRMVSDPLEAVRVFESDPSGFDAIVTDQTMPGMTGAELVRRAKAARPDVAAVMCTGHSDLIDEEGAKKMGMAAFLRKPYDRNGLGSALATALGKDG